MSRQPLAVVEALDASEPFRIAGSDRATLSRDRSNDNSHVAVSTGRRRRKARKRPYG